MERDFTIGETNFKVSKINAMKQFHLIRRLSPVLKEMIPVATKIARSQKVEQSAEMSEQLLEEVVMPIMDGISKLSDEDSTKVLIGLLSAVEMQQPSGNWARMAGEHGLMFDEITLPVLLQAAGRAFMYNLSGFFEGLPRVSHGKG